MFIRYYIGYSVYVIYFIGVHMVALVVKSIDGVSVNDIIYENYELISEGIVWHAVNRPYDPGLWFKSKGLLHKGADANKEKVYKKLSATPEHVEGMNTLLDLLLPTWRLEQGYQYISDVAGGEPTNKHTGAFLKWIHADVLKEEIDRITANGLAWKDVVGAISKRAKNYLFMRIGNFDSVENSIE